jgi:fluoride ion exporter CrcB/FEX
VRLAWALIWLYTQAQRQDALSARNVLVNISGCFIVGFFLTLISERLILHPNWRLAIAVGFVGA